MHVYTRKGDRGQTRLADGTSHGKNEDIFEVIGTIDELNSWLGMCITHINKRKSEDPKTLKTKAINNQLVEIQNNLFSINSILARAKKIKFDVKRETKNLEREIDKMEKELPVLRNFILPGGHALAAILHICRTVCRRAELRLTASEFTPYVNRLSDYLFTLARWVNYAFGVEEKIWRR